MAAGAGVGKAEARVLAMLGPMIAAREMVAEAAEAGVGTADEDGVLSLE